MGTTDYDVSHHDFVERLRQSGIRLDRKGRWWHEGAEVTHQRFRQALFRWLDCLPDGRTILRFDESRYAYVDVDDAHLLVTSVCWKGEHAMLTLNDETSEELYYPSIAQASDNSLYCRVRRATLLARFQTHSYFQLAERIEETQNDDGQFALRADGRLQPIASC